jgi:hypothetical protein
MDVLGKFAGMVSTAFKATGDHNVVRAARIFFGSSIMKEIPSRKIEWRNASTVSSRAENPSIKVRLSDSKAVIALSAMSIISSAI